MAQQPSKASSAANEAVTSLVGPVMTARGLVLEDVTITPAGKRRVVRVVVDLPSGPGSLDLDAVAEVAHAVSETLDAAEDGPGRGPLGGSPYVLEVTSPGVDRPLTDPRHWSRATGRLVRTTVAGQPVDGRVARVDDDGVYLQLDEEPAERMVAWHDLGPGAVQVEFNRRDPAGPDEHEED
jgi:ribosome maturation factor RimP